MVDFVKNNPTPPTAPDPTDDNESKPGDRKEVSISVAVGIAIIIAGVLLVIGILAYRTSDVTTDVDTQTQNGEADEVNQEETNQTVTEAEPTPQQPGELDESDQSDITQELE